MRKYNRKHELLDFANNYEHFCIDNDKIDLQLFDEYGVQRGLRDKNGKGVLAGLTRISKIEAFEDRDGRRVPAKGKLFYRGYNIQDLIRDYAETGRFGFTETAFLLLFGTLPTAPQLKDFNRMIGLSYHTLPRNFNRDVIMKGPSKDIMNSLTKSVLTLASYDENVAGIEISNVIRQCLELITLIPVMAIYAYHAYNHYRNYDSLYIHRPDPELSPAENILRLLRPDKQYTQLEARVLDIALILHMEHGGGNNSTFTARVVTSAGSDTYSVMAAALSSLKGPRHGGANLKVVEMIDDIKKHVKNLSDKEELTAYLGRILDKNAFDRQGLIYGMGHAVYSISDPRALAFQGFVEKLAFEKGRHDDYQLYADINEIAPKLISDRVKIYKGVSANVDFYSGFVYNMLGIPVELFTPMFATARIVGWSAHRLEELINMDKIIRPAYGSIMEEKILK